MTDSQREYHDRITAILADVEAEEEASPEGPYRDSLRALAYGLRGARDLTSEYSRSSASMWFRHAEETMYQLA
jgi:hypothetical protein